MSNVKTNGKANSNRVQLVLATTVALIFSAGWTCGPPVTTNSGFDLWCGKTLCGWTVDQGEIARVPTWHRSDYGVELVGDLVVISQLLDEHTRQGKCYQLTLQADADAGVDLKFQMDFFDNGTIDYTRTLEGSGWQRLDYPITTPISFDNVRVKVTKTGSGRAILNMLRVHDPGENCTDPPIEVNSRALDAPCETASQCLSGLCTEIRHGLTDWGDVDPVTTEEYDVLFRLTEKTCSKCDADNGCETGEICGMSYRGNTRWTLACSQPALLHLGDRCYANAECKNGVCCGSVCSECCTDVDCSDGKTCERIEDPSTTGDGVHYTLPKRCSPIASLNEVGESCLAAADCQSGACEGAGLMQTCEIYGNRCTDGGCGDKQCLTVGQLEGVCQ